MLHVLVLLLSVTVVSSHVIVVGSHGVLMTEPSRTGREGSNPWLSWGKPRRWTPVPREDTASRLPFTGQRHRGGVDMTSRLPFTGQQHAGRHEEVKQRQPRGMAISLRGRSPLREIVNHPDMANHITGMPAPPVYHHRRYSGTYGYDRLYPTSHPSLLRHHGQDRPGIEPYGAYHHLLTLGNPGPVSTVRGQGTLDYGQVEVITNLIDQLLAISLLPSQYADAEASALETAQTPLRPIPAWAEAERGSHGIPPLNLTPYDRLGSLAEEDLGGQDVQREAVHPELQRLEHGVHHQAHLQQYPHRGDGGERASVATDPASSSAAEALSAELGDPSEEEFQSLGTVAGEGRDVHGNTGHALHEGGRGRGGEGGGRGGRGDRRRGLGAELDAGVGQYGWREGGGGGGTAAGGPGGLLVSAAEEVSPASSGGSFGSFPLEDKDCDGILTKTCAADSQCQCYGFYFCSGGTCIDRTSASGNKGALTFGGNWHTGPATVLGLTRRR